MAKPKSLSTPPDKFFRKKPSADYLGICTSTFDNLIALGIIPPGRKISARITLWDKTELDALVENAPVAKKTNDNKAIEG